ncbi:hypothetical protein BC835DRAFT_1337404 [Cytidiella melzeri]|nr:hypothetical protein BC835DRAFT_1337404 [Cytidiella melzeri]
MEVDALTIYLVLSLPLSSDQFTTIGALSNPAHLNIRLLDAPMKLDPATLSFSTKPRRQRLLGTFSVSAGETMTAPTFKCATASYQTVELECSDSECVVDVTHVGYSAAGLFIWQSQTV